MISLYAETPLCTFALIFFTFVINPLLKMTHPILRFFSYLCNPHQLPEDSDHFRGYSECEIDLPVLKFQDLAFKNREEAIHINEEEEEVCAICLMEFEKEDFVNELPRCKHIFHKECMEKWLDRCQFTCPLCRSMVFSVPNSSSPCDMWDFSFCVLPHSHDS